MLVLAIETATVNCSVALLHLDKVIAEECVALPRVHSVLLMPMVAQLYQRASAIPSETGLIAVSAGPGSFTGLRIGMATAKGLALCWSKPCVAVGTLDAIALQVLQTAATGLRRADGPLPLVCAVLKSRQDELYYGLFRWEGGGVQPVCDVGTGAPQAVARWVASVGSPVVVVGEVEGAEGHRLAQELEKLGVEFNVAPQWLCRPRASTVGVMGMVLWREGRATDARGLSPAYVRRSEAEVKWSLKQGRE
ncbi:MAG: tRNA (adenosine(37)-N6)-threonylcarbamoyltransferase complex dimerization subunit type 1 TsaB [Bacillota bacterium]